MSPTSLPSYSSGASSSCYAVFDTASSDVIFYDSSESDEKFKKHVKHFKVKDKFGVDNASQMLKKMKEIVGECKCIDRLTIVGHGRVGGDDTRRANVRIGGSDWIGVGTGEINTIDYEKSDMYKFGSLMKNAMCENCTINVATCGGKSHSKIGIALALSTGCTVRIADNSCYRWQQRYGNGGVVDPPGYKGGRLEGWRVTGYDGEGEIREFKPDGNGNVTSSAWKKGADVKGTGVWK